MSCEREQVPPLTVLPPDGTRQCALDPGEGPCPLDNCCNYWQQLPEGQGNSFLFSAGGNQEDPLADGFSFGTTLADCDPYTCPVPAEPAELQNLGAGFLDPGALTDVICMRGLTPGTYKAEARWTLRAAVPGARALIVYRPNCDDPSVEYAVCDCYAPCADFQCVAQRDIVVKNYYFLNQIDKNCCCSLIVPVSTCNPGFRLLVKEGCMQEDIFDTIPTGQTPTRIQNIQFSMIRMTTRDVVDCGNNPIQPVTAHFALPDSLDCEQ